MKSFKPHSCRAGILVIAVALLGVPCVFGKIVIVAAQEMPVGRLVAPFEVISRLSDRSGLFLVDVREAESFRRLKIPGSLNIPLHAVRTKDFLRGGTVVLVNEGFERRELLRQCGILEESGFGKTAVLEGGLLGWISAGGPMEGDPIWEEEARKVSPRALYAEREREDVIVVDRRDPAMPRETPLPSFPQLISVPPGSAEELVRTLEAETRRRTGDVPPAFVVPCRDPQECRPLIAAMKNRRGNGGVASARVFFLEGGMDSYRVFVEGRAKSEKRLLQRNEKNCRECP